MSVLERLSTSYLSVRKPVFELFEGVGTAAASASDIGYYGSYYDGTNIRYTGLYRDESDADNAYILFENMLSGGLPTMENGFTFSTDAKDMQRASLKLKNISASGDANITGTTSITGALNVDGDADFDAKLDVAGAANFQSTVDIIGATSITGALNVDGDADFDAKLDVAGTANFQSTVDIIGATSITGALNVDGDADFDAKLDVAGAALFRTTIEVTGNSDLNGELDVAGTANFQSTVDITGATSITGALNVDGDADFDAKLDVAGTANFQSTVDIIGATSITGALNVDGDVDFDAKLDVAGAANFRSTIDASGIVTLTGGVPSTSTGTGDLVVTGGVGIGDDLWIGGNLHVAGDVSMPPNPFEVLVVNAYDAKSNDYTISVENLKAYMVVFVDVESAGTIKLPSLAALTRLDGGVNYSYRISIINLTGNVVTVEADFGGGESIEGHNSYVLNHAYDKQTLIAGPNGKPYWLIE